MTETNSKLEILSGRKTAVGNYFVSNYPPFSFWSPSHVDQALSAMERPHAPGTSLGIYLHIPFCRKRCHFCYFKVYTDKNSSEIRTYLDAMIRELGLYATKPCIGGRRLRFIYFGGGTPSYLSADQLQFLTDEMKRVWGWDQAEEITFECEPGTLNEKKLWTLKEIGITRLSLGVEHFDDEILKLNNRAHGSMEISRAYDFARSVEFPQINIDLIAGMLGETPAKWAACVDRAVHMQPDSVTIYQMEIPYNTTIYKEMKAGGETIAPVADWETKREWVSRAFLEFEKAGYTVTSAYTAVRDPARTHFVYRDALWTGADLIGIGVASFGLVNGAHYQNIKDMDPYHGSVQEGRLPIHRALTMSDEERLVRELVLQLKRGEVSVPYFRSKFSVDIQSHFAEPLRRLRDNNLITVGQENIQLTRDALLRVDGLLPEFFLPEHRNARYT